MKKMFKTVASLALGCALLSTSAFAALDGSVAESETAGTYTATVTKADATAWESTILVLKAGSVDATGAEPVIASTVNDGDIYYINQTSAKSATATYSIAETTEKLYVFAGGSDETAAKYLGAIEANIPAAGVTIGTIAEDVFTAYAETGALTVGDELTLAAQVAPENTTDTVVWSSSDDTKATVVNGVVTAKAAGEVTITATAGAATDTVVFTISEKVEEPTGAEAIAITLNGEEVTEAAVNILSTIKFDVAITGTAASDVVWTVDDGGVGTIENGLYTPAEFIDDPFDSTGIGEFTVTATVDGKSDSVKLRVWRYGDVTGDGVIDTDDVLSILYFNMYMYDEAGVLGSMSGDPYALNLDFWAEAAADVTCDGMVDTDDSLNVDFYSMYMFDDSVLDGLMPQ